MPAVTASVPSPFTVGVKCFCIATCISARTGSDAGDGPEVLDLNILEAWFLQVLAMELLNHFKSVGKIGSMLPSLFTNFVTLPMNKIFQSFTVDTRIKDFGDFEFFFTINLNWRWRCL